MNAIFPSLRIGAGLISLFLFIFLTLAQPSSAAVMCRRLFEDKPAQEDIVHMINSIQTEFDFPAPYGFQHMSFERLQYITTHPEYAELISQRNNAMKGQIKPFSAHTAETVAFMARFILAELDMNLNANKPLRDAFQQQAQIAGLQIKVWPTLYRFDTRTPQQVAAAQGFQGNNHKAKHSLMAHSLPESTGGAWTSLSKKEANHFILRDNYLQSIYKSVDALHPGTREYEILSQLTSIKKDSTYMFYRSYEYQIQNQKGTEPKFGIAREEEVVAPEVTVDHITHYREAIYFFEVDYINNLKVPHKDWDELRPNTESLYLGPWTEIN